jgi:dTDP-4-amino-4,6-dideoxygalactose transaminase
MSVEKLAIEGGTPTIGPGGHRRRPDLHPADREAIVSVLEDGALWDGDGKQLAALQRAWAELVGSHYCLAVNSESAALHCAVVAAGVDPGDEVIVPAFSAITTPMSVLHADATPVFCDIDPRTFTIDPARIESLITDRTRAIMPVHVHGLAADMDAIRTIADDNDLVVIEHAAQAHAATYRGKRVGTFGDCAAFGLAGARSAGAVGLFVTDDAEAYVTARRVAVLGADAPTLNPREPAASWSHGVGWNYRADELTAACARSQLSRLPSFNDAARRNADRLTAGLKELAGFTPPYVPEDRTSDHHRYRVRVDPQALGFTGPPIELRDRLWSALRAEGVAVAGRDLLPIAAAPVFRRGRSYRAWSPGVDDIPLEPWDPGSYPETTALLSESILIGSELEPLQLQDGDLIERYVDAFRKVAARMDAVLAAPYEPARRRPEARC